MKLSNQTNKILGKDWLKYHPYSNITPNDSYYIALCNNVLKIIQESEIRDHLENTKEEKELACMLVSYFEDIISETHLFSSFTRQHKKMYGKELPFYKINEDYYEDEINLQDIYFLIWYYISLQSEEIIIDPYFENTQAFNEAVTDICNLFNNEFEEAPQNENLQNFLQIDADSDVGTIREKLSFIAYHSFLWKTVFDNYLEKILNEHSENGTVVLDEENEMSIYDQQIHFIFNECMPLLSMRANEYYAEILGEEHSESQFVKNISKRIFGCFLLRKIERDGYLIEHLTSKKQLRLSNEYTSLEKVKLVENETVLSLGLVQWKNDVWQNQGGCITTNIEEMKGEDISKHLFDDENHKKETVHKLEMAFLKINNGKRIAYFSRNREFTEFYLKVLREHAKIIKPEITDEELDENYKDFIKNYEKNIPFKNDEAFGIFFNSNIGIEMYSKHVISCMPDENNPYYANKDFDLNDLLTAKSLSKEFVNYIIENKLINLQFNYYENQDTFNIIMENLDFLLRFYRRTLYFSKPEVTINN